MIATALSLLALLQIAERPRVTATQSDLVVISVGLDDGVMVGREFSLYRGADFVAKMCIQHVDRRWSAGRITLKKSEARVGDLASTILRREAFVQAFVDEMLHWARDFDPVAASRMAAALRAKREDDAMDLARAFEPRKTELEVLKAVDPAEFERLREGGKLEGEAVRLAEAFRDARGDDRGPARERLLEALGKAFEHREAARGAEAGTLERRLNELKAILKRRAENRAKILDRRAQELLGDEYDW